MAAGGHTPYVAVIVWHDVVPAKELWFDTPLDTFKTQLAAIARGGYHDYSVLTESFTMRRPASLAEVVPPPAGGKKVTA